MPRARRAGEGAALLIAPVRHAGVLAPGTEVLAARWFDAGRNVGSPAAQALRLLDAYGASVLTTPVAEMISRGTHAQDRPPAPPIALHGLH